MKIIRDIKSIGVIAKPVVALGVFDGVHRGHRRILEAAVRKAHSVGGTSVVLTFDPHPRNKRSLYSMRHRLKIFVELGIDMCIVINFSRSFARMSAPDFVRNILYRRIRAHTVCVGENFKFGRDARGRSGMLSGLARRYDFRVRAFRAVRAGGAIISSTRIRKLIEEGKLSRAARLLSRPVGVLGTVVRGGEWAGRMGFPTANIYPHHEVIPPAGIYAVNVLFEGSTLPGVCYIGADPTLKSGRPLHVEVHIFDFHGDLYGRELEIHFIQKIRGEKLFPSKEALIERIKKDIAKARTIFARK